MIPIFTIDDHNRIIARTELVPPLRSQGPTPIDLTSDMPVGDQIVLRPDVPPLGTQEFDTWLRNWHATYNAPTSGTLIIPEVIQDYA